MKTNSYILENMVNNMIVKIFTLKNGLEEIQDVRVIRILSKEYSLCKPFASRQNNYIIN